jgi:CubicO group peptidase (beta-lactamase class C family)
VRHTAGVVDGDALTVAVDGARARQAPGVADMTAYLQAILEGQTHAEVIGPVRDPAGTSGLVVHRGEVVAQWGDPASVEMCFSVSKSYLALVAGIAFDRGLLPDLHEPVAATVPDDAFSGDRHGATTWDHLLRQTSDWSGTLWGKPWHADPQGNQAPDADLGPPGEVFAYNDVRINLLALALTRRFGRGLEDVLRDEVMEPIGASDTWAWHGYTTSLVAIDGRDVEVVSGGAHWGGGLWMSALDHARIGRLLLQRGEWGGRRILSETWIDAMTSPAATNPDYGMLWWLNHRGKVWPSAPPSGFCARGNLGRQLLWIDPGLDLVVVSRWSDHVDRLLAEVSAAVSG